VKSEKFGRSTAFRCLVAVVVAGAAVVGVAAQEQAKTTQTKAKAATKTTTKATTAKKQFVANDADIAFAMETADKALKQYNALSDAQKSKLEAQVAKALGEKDVAAFSRDVRATAATFKAKTLSTKENRAALKKFLDENQRWCATVKATRVTRQAMAKMGMNAEMSLDDLLKLMPE